MKHLPIKAEIVEIPHHIGQIDPNKKCNTCEAYEEIEGEPNAFYCSKYDIIVKKIKQK